MQWCEEGGQGQRAGASGVLAVKAGRRKILSSRPPCPLDGRYGKRSISKWVPLHLQAYLEAHITYAIRPFT